MNPERVKIGGVIELAEAPPQRVEDASALLIIVICTVLFLCAIEEALRYLDRRGRL